MACSASTMALANEKLLDFLRPSKTKLLENNPNKTGNNMKPQIKNKKEQKNKFVELLIPT